MTGPVRRAMAYLAVLAVVLVVWQLLTVLGAVPVLVLPTPASVGEALRGILSDPASVWAAVTTTLGEAALAFTIAAILGVVVGVGLGLSRVLRDSYEPLLANLNAVPLVILYPVLAAVLGLGSASKVALGAMYGFFPVAIACLAATSHVDRDLVTAARAMGAHRRRVLVQVVMPAISGPLTSGLRAGLGLALVTVVAGEFIAGTAGLGYQLAASSEGFHAPALYAWLLITVAVIVALNGGLTALTYLSQKGLRR